jgi:tetratricopeptide (TPR) repeat protein
MNENLFVKAIKIEEKSRNFEGIRYLLGGLKDVPFERSWRMILEGALFEGRCGNRETARKAFRHLIKNCQSYAPVYLEASKYEEREGEVEKALIICDEGLQYNCKYGPLWFQYLRLYEKTGCKAKIRYDGLEGVLDMMFHNINKELYWKVYIEAAQTYERLLDNDSTFDYLMNSVTSSPENLKWKIWIIASRSEYKLGNYKNARKLIERCLS